MLTDDLFADAQRQLNVCNSCRYCEGYCPVWPALTLHDALTQQDVVHLANLCHDCRACFSACMYTAPHEFDLNPPRLFTEVRTQTYERYAWRPALPPGLQRFRPWLWAAVIVVLALVLAPVLASSAQSGAPPGSPYRVIPHLLLIAVVAAPFAWCCGALTVWAGRYWHDVGGAFADLRHARHWRSVLTEAAQLRHLGGGGGGCDYPESEPSPARRVLHHAVSYGLGLCLVSTISAAILQDIMGSDPPYPVLSVPVVSGSVGGLGMVAGCLGLLVLKGRSDPTQSTPTTTRADYVFLSSLAVLAGTGLLTLAVRFTPAFAPLLALHLVAVVAAFVVAPYTKFVHWIYRLLALYKNSLEGGELVAHHAADAVQRGVIS